MTTEVRARGTFETTVEICCHRVAIRYWGFDHKLTRDLKRTLVRHGIYRAKRCIIDGCRSGDLNCYYHDDATEEEIRGWWEIERD
jgi:hypothetical protein